MSSFSERMGVVKPPEFLQLDSMTDELSNLLYNYCEFFLADIISKPSGFDFNPKALEYLICNLLKKKNGTFNLISKFVGNNYYLDKAEFAIWWSRWAWHERYTMVEYITGIYCRKEKQVLRSLNKILEQENSAYRMNDECKLIAIADDCELAEVEQAQVCGIETVRDHINNAVSLFSDREKPDYSNAIKEAISAVESLAVNLTGEKGTLGQLIKKVDCHPSLRQAISSLYGYTSDEGGIRHSHGMEIIEIDFDTAKYIIVICSALINYVLVKHGTTKNSFTVNSEQ